MRISLAVSHAIAEIAESLYEFLPGNPHPFADQRISFKGVAHDLRLSGFWSAGSKRPAIIGLLERTLTDRPTIFCALMVEVVRRGIGYRKSKGIPLVEMKFGHSTS